MPRLGPVLADPSRSLAPAARGCKTCTAPGLLPGQAIGPKNGPGLATKAYEKPGKSASKDAEMGIDRREATPSLVIGITATVLVLVLAMGWLMWQRCGWRGCPDVELVTGYLPDEASVVLDREGEEVTKLYRVHRVMVELESLPAHVPTAFIAVEDQRFWRHRGVDWRRVLGAAWSNLRAMEVEEGGSTITMQLARNIFPDELPQRDRSLARKLGEMRVAREIERRFTKEEILELYLNQIYFGSGAWGIEAAAREYFGKAAAELTLSEAALLAGLIPAPSRLNPRADLEAARAERERVLRKLVRLGWIEGETAAAAAAEEIRLARGELDPGDTAPYYVEEVRRYLESQLGERLYTGGYRIHTALDRSAQRIAEEELENQLRAIEAGRFGRFVHARYDASAEAANYLQGAVVVMDVETGDVLALVGGRDFEQSKFNRATQARRQPGSAFKPFVYAAAANAGYGPAHGLQDSPMQLVLDGGRVWSPRNFGNSYAGSVSMRQALVQSRNVATVRMAEEVGVSAVIRMAHRLGISSPIPHLPSVSIGAAEVRVLELTAAYSAFATLGHRPEPRLVSRVEDRNGRIVLEQQPRSDRVLDSAVAFLVTDMLRDVVDRGTGTPVRAAGFGAPAAGKTGTTNDNTDVWFVGFTPSRVAGVWIGFDRPRTIVSGATGGALAAPVWGRVMNRTGAAAGGWSPPAGIERRLVVGPGLVVAADCPMTPNGVREEYFLAGSVPPGRCGSALWEHLYEDRDDLLGEPLYGDPFGPPWRDAESEDPEASEDPAPADPDLEAPESAEPPDTAEPPELLGEPVDTLELPLPRPDTSAVGSAGPGRPGG